MPQPPLGFWHSLLLFLNLTLVFRLAIRLKHNQGQSNRAESGTDLNGVEMLHIMPLVTLVLLLGIYPKLLASRSRSAISFLATHYKNYHLPKVEGAESGRGRFLR